MEKGSEMIAYGFQPQFESDVANGLKPLTLRRPRKPPARHAAVGEMIGLWVNMRTPAARMFATGCVAVHALTLIDGSGIKRIQGFAEPGMRKAPARLASPALAKLHQAITGRDSDAIARLDGFADWRAAWAFHDGNRSEAEIDAPHLMRHLIAWRIEPADAIDAAPQPRGDAA